MPQFNHLIVLAFDMNSDRDDGADISLEDYLKAAENRLAEIKKDDNIEAFEISETIENQA